MTDKSLYERLGGTYGIAAAVDVLVEKLFKNEIINQNPAVEDFHKHEANKPGYKVLVTTWSIEKTGGPKCYHGRDMLEAHKHLNISGDHFLMFLERLIVFGTLDELGCPAAERDEFLGLASYRDEVVSDTLKDKLAFGSSQSN